MKKANTKKPAAKKAQKPSKAKVVAKVLSKKPKKEPKITKSLENTTGSEPSADEVPLKESAIKKSKKAIEAIVEEVKSPENDIKTESEIVLTDAEGRRYCRVQDCDQIAVVEVYCRYHYLLHWKRIQYRKKILNDNKLFTYIDELTFKYPDKFLEVIRKDLSSLKSFTMAIQEMEIDDSDPDTAQEQDDARSYIDEVRGVGGEVPESADDDF